MIIAINKPVGPTSFDIVAQVRKITGIKKVGHAGTLDPLASGVLVIAIGREDTKQLDSIVSKEKEYLAEVTLGLTSSTDDAEGEKTEVSSLSPTLESVRLAVSKFIGQIQQVPPQFSAIKVAGQRAYKTARQGGTTQLPARPVEIFSIELSDYAYPKISIKVKCGPGTYIRSLARDLGVELKTGAYMSGLIRTRVGDYDLKQALTIDEFKNFYDQQKSSGDQA